MDLNVEENTLNIKMLMFLLYTILVKKKISFFLRNRILSISIFKVNYSLVISNLGEGKLRYEFEIVNFQFLNPNN